MSTVSTADSPSPTVLVVGSTGNVGNATVLALAARGTSTRAGCRDPSSEKAVKLAALDGVETVRADLTKPETLSAAMAGVCGVFIVTPGAEDRVALVDAGIAAAKAAGVQHIVVVSVPSVDADEDILVKRQFRAIEASVKASSVAFTLLRLPMFFDNQWASQGSIKRDGKIYGPADPAKQASFVSVADVGEATAAVLSNLKDHRNSTYTLSSETISFNGIAAAFSSVLGRDIAYIHVPYDAAKESMAGMGFPGWLVEVMLSLNKLIDNGSPAAVADTAALAQLLGKPPTSFAAWATGVASAFNP